MSGEFTPAALAERHYPWACRLAWAFASSQPLLESDEAAGVAAEALVRCAIRWRPDRGASFQTYASKRIYGALLDEVRALAHTRRRKGENPVVVSLEKLDALGRSPATHERIAGAEAWIDTIEGLRLLPVRVTRRSLLVAAGWTLTEVGSLDGVTAAAVSLSTTAAARALRAA